MTLFINALNSFYFVDRLPNLANLTGEVENTTTIIYHDLLLAVPVIRTVNNRLDHL